MARISCVEFLAVFVVCALLMLTVQAKSSQHLCRFHRCPPGHVCKVIQVNCVTTPCPPLPTCVRIKPPVHSGHCPPRKPGFIGPCVVYCYSDADCGINEKCCGSCPRACTKVKPISGKPGVCPYYFPWGLTKRLCGRPCVNDSDCAGIQKCCKAGHCGTMCMTPLRGFYFARNTQ